MTNTTSPEFILTQYNLSHNPETGKRMYRRQVLLLINRLKKEKFSDNDVLDWLLYFDTLPSPVAQLTACKWMCDATIILPEDEYKVLQAVKVAKLNHVDPLSYPNPMEIINAFPRIKETLKPIDPATINTLHFRYSNGTGMDVYDVDESEESRENMRRIIDTHFGPDCNPWCLLASGKDGKLTRGSASCWKYYSAFPKRVAFQNGRLLAFSANSCYPRIWWDRMDQPTGGTRWEYMPIPNDPLHRTARYQTDKFTGYCELVGGIYRGSKENGLCERYRSIDATEPYSREFYCNGKRLMQTWKGLSYAKKKEIFNNSDWGKGIIHIPESIKKIPAQAFANAHKLTEIYIPDTVKTLGDYLFEGCTSLRKVRLPSHLTSIPSGMFIGCRSLESIILPDGVTEIGVNAFNGCVNLKSIELPYGVVNIKDRAFSGCTSLSGLKIPELLESIGKGAFQGCRSIQEIHIPSCVMTVGNGAFGGCSFKEVVIPETIKSIQVGAFAMCLNIQTITVCRRWYGLFRERYGRKVQLLQNSESNPKQCA